MKRITLEKEIIQIDFYGHPVSVLLPGDSITEGNKFFKLKYNFQFAEASNIHTLISMGGAYSNHIAALAEAGREKGFRTIGLIRGEETQTKSVTLQRAEQNGMQLIFVSRDIYRQLRENHDMITELYPDALFLPEGGSNALAVKGCSEILIDIDVAFDVVMLAVGTGATIAGIATSLKPGQKALGIAVIRNGTYLEKNIDDWLEEYPNAGNYTLNHDYHCGGYAKSTEELMTFIRDFNALQPFHIEPVYTGKVFFALHQLLKESRINKDEKILVVHTGGLQYLK